MKKISSFTAIGYPKVTPKLMYLAREALLWFGSVRMSKGKGLLSSSSQNEMKATIIVDFRRSRSREASINSMESHTRCSEDILALIKSAGCLPLKRINKTFG